MNKKNIERIATERIDILMDNALREINNDEKFIVPGVNSRIRIGRSKEKCIRITCMKCNHVYRKIIAS